MDYRMSRVRDQLSELFNLLDVRIGEINRERRREGLPAAGKARIRLLGQISLLVDEGTSTALHLTQTADVDALLSMDHAAKEELKKLLKDRSYIYDEDSNLVWIPDGSTFFVNLDNLEVEFIDPESALVSKAVKAPEKNRQLIRQAIASEAYPSLVDRILKLGGSLEEFL
jgi:hypothetical protein